MRYFGTLSLLAVLAIGCVGCDSTQVAPATPRTVTALQPVSVKVVGTPANIQATERTHLSPEQNAVPSSATQTHQPSGAKEHLLDNGAGTQARSFMAMSSEERLQWADTALESRGLNVHDPQ
jgi:hypothetical protein